MEFATFNGSGSCFGENSLELDCLIRTTIFQIALATSVRGGFGLLHDPDQCSFSTGTIDITHVRANAPHSDISSAAMARARRLISSEPEMRPVLRLGASSV